MPRFFLENIKSGVISGDDARHISRVLRMKKGDQITICDTMGTDYLCSISDFSKTDVFFNVISSAQSETESEIKVSIFQALPKSTKMDYIIQKCTELGVYDIYTVSMAHCVVRLDDTDAEKKVLRWQAVSEAAAKQSMRGIIPEIHNPIDFKIALERMASFDLCFVCYENEIHTTLKSVLKCEKSKPESIAFLIGPEGGISEEEITLVKAKGIPCVTLGKRILRTETASTAVLAAINYEFDK